MAIEDEATEFDNMSDDDFMKLEMPPVVMTESAPETEDASADGEAVEDAAASPEAGAVVDEADEDALSDTADADLGDKPTPHHTEPKPTKEVAAVSKPDEEKAPVAEADPASAPVNYEEEYKRIMAPFKANNRDFTPSSPEEAIRLMQMGANYTKKMQSLTPNLKLMRMLDNNGLLDEGKINFLIDLNRKDPGAIQKLIHESKIDPLDLSTTDEPNYKPSNHAVSDQEMQFHEALGDVLSAPNGRETVQMINTQWDKASKEALYREPALLAIINEQQINGIGARITAEIDRQKILGNLTDVPFLQAYKTVGDSLHQRGLLIPAANPAAAADTAPAQAPRPQASAPRVLETRVAAPRPQVTNNAAARAASPSKASAPASKPDFDPFSMSDAEIMAISSPPRA